jgi:hypothetical protein
VRRFRRILLNAATVLSLLLFAATVALWVRSYGRHVIIDLGGGAPDFATFQRTGKANGVVVIHRGVIMVARYSWRDPAAQRYYVVGPPFLGIRYSILALCTASLPAIRLAMWWRRWRRRRPEGCCRACGYDLRATPERCPECGAVPKGDLI